MKRLRKIIPTTLVFVLIIASSYILFACKDKKKDNLNEIGASLSNYYMDIEYDNSIKTANSTCEIDFCNPTETMLKEVKLHLYVASFTKNAKSKVVSDLNKNNAFYNGDSYASLNINRVKLNDQDINPSYENEDNDIMVITLNSSLYPSERVNINIEYSFSLPNCNHRFGYGENTINFGNFYPIVCAYNNGWQTNSYCPTGDPFNSEMANYYVSLCTDEKLVLANTGKVTSSTTDNGKAYYNIEAKCVRDFAFVLSEKFKTISKNVNDVECKYYFVSDENPEKSLNCTVDAIKTFSKYFYNYPYPTYSVVESDFCYGGMEYPNLSLISNQVTNVDDYLNVIVHETAHQWWYNLVGNDEFNTPWLDESLTEYSCVLFYDLNKDYNYNHKDMIDSAHSNYVFYQNVYKDVLGKVNADMRRPINEYDTEPEYTFTIYVKGVLMYDSLYNLIGKENFYKALKKYAHDNAYSISSEAHLIACFESVTNTSLENFFDCWLDGKVIIN